MAHFGYDTYLSPFTWRYASKRMQSLFSEKQRRLEWRKIWVALADAQNSLGLVSKDELNDIKVHATEVDVEKSLEVEKKIRHDIVAELRFFAGQCKIGGGKIHWGATSMDVNDNAEILTQKAALALIVERTAAYLKAMNVLMEKHASTPCLAYTHLQAAEPTTLGYRFSMYAQDALNDLEALEALQKNLKAKGLKGAVGNAASYKAAGVDAEKLEASFLKSLGLEAFEITSQTYPRKQDYIVANALASLAQSLYKFALDVRLMQMLDEASEPFGKNQVGSSAMPFKRNPISSERVCSLARYVSVFPQVAWENAANSGLERTLDDSGNRRLWLPEIFLALDETLLLATKVADGLVVNEKIIRKNLEKHAPFALSEKWMMKEVKKGRSRQELHEELRSKAMKAWEAVQDGKENPLAVELNIKNSDVIEHAGLAEKKAKAFSKKLGKRLAGYKTIKEEAGF